MKRWQDRGEVLDSDDEEISLDAESQSPQRPAKRQRIGGDEVVARDGAGGEEQGQGEDDVAWLYPKPAVTYGRRTAVSDRNLSNTTSLATPGPGADDHPPKGSTRSSENATDGQKALEDLFSSSQVNESEGLPDVDDILGNPINGRAADEPELFTGFGAISSSPLTEREVSPSPPPESGRFRLPALTLTSDPVPSPGLQIGDNISNDHVLAEELSRPAVGRRNFRARQEKQLHPYMFDKAQYQQQCRDRGMRPVRVMEAQQQANETQDASASGDESQSSQIVYNNSSSSPVPAESRTSPIDENNSPSGQTLNASDNSDDDLPDPATFKRTISHGIQNGAKRRRLFHSKRTSKFDHPTKPSHQASTHIDTQDDFSVPPSPPPTSSDQDSIRQRERGMATFKMPLGLTPMPLPTPRVSSDVRNSRLDDNDSLSDAEVPRTRSRPSTTSRPRPQVMAISSSNESSDTEPEADLEERRLHREKRRIRGVLPASWLKIDFKAQQKPKSLSPSRNRRLSSSSLERTSPQKGVARVVSGRPVLTENSGIIDISDDDRSDHVSRQSSPSQPRMRQMKLQFEKRNQPAERQQFVDIDEMEVDWIDPMFGGSSSRRTKSTKQRQPKIAGAFRSSSNGSDFSEERKGLSSRRSAGKTQRKWNKKHRERAPQSKAQRLSILDAPAQERQSTQKPPQFVRLATRNARKRSDHARHSPTHKQIRLATRGDTEEATQVLRAWREGTIAPRHVESAPRTDSTTQPSTSTHPTQHGRPPLAERSHNPQQRLPSPFRKEQKSSKVNSRAPTGIRRPRLQQTRLQPQILQHEPTRRAEPTYASPDTAQVQKPRRRQNLQTTSRYRGAQLESLEDEFDHNHRAAAFERRMQLLTEGISRRYNRNVDVQLERFLQESTPATRDPNAPLPASEINRPKNFEIPGPKEALPHRTRKRRAQRIDAEAREYRQPSEPLPEIQAIDADHLADQLPEQSQPTLQGLGPFGTRYATDFDILPLSVGTYFHESSFIGSGDFAAALSFAHRDLDTPTGRITIHVDGEILEWGAWTEDVAVGLSHIPRAVSTALQALEIEGDSVETVSLVLSNVDYLLRSTIRYFSRCVDFLDPVDRVSCIERLRTCIEDLFEAVNDAGPATNRHSEITVRCLQHALVLARQALALCNHHVVRGDIQKCCRDLVNRAAHRLAGKVFLPGCLDDLRSFYDENRHASKREAGIRDSDITVCAVVTLYHALDEQGAQSLPFWDIVHQHHSVDVLTVTSISQLDRTWYDLFSLLPLSEIDGNGIARIGSRLQGARENWTLVRKLVDNLFHLYSASLMSHGSTVNDYVRATLKRCHCLVTRWGWWKCEPILGSIFDFFARRGLSLLHKEESRGSPRFLEELASGPSIGVQSEDRSFHIFLKILASGLTGIAQHGIYTAKKIGAISWRFIPNHGRTYRKDIEVRQEDLDSLRNHHDLLCTLYYATPAGHRLRVDLIRNLVDHSASHREACRLSVRAWGNLASFQISTKEGDELLEPFVSWYREIISTTISQYRLARSEVEQDVAAANATGQPLVPQHIIEDTIARNQRQISATLVDALAALKRALLSASSLKKARLVLEGTAFWQVFDLFDPSSRRLNGVLDEALAVVHAALDVQDKLIPLSESQGNSEESQDYGDSSALLEFASSGPDNETIQSSVVDLIHGPVSQLVSNVFGADAVSDDALLTKIINTWIELGQKTVRAGKWQWAHYITDYNSDAWNQLRDTEQRRKYTPYFLSRIVDVGDLDLAEVPILSWWLNSLVEREAMLKFQHVLTNSLLNRHFDEPLLHNLPFSKPANAAFNISLQELRQRRPALISSILSNLRHNFDTSLQSNPSAVQGLRRDYSATLKSMMQAMKSRYQNFSTTSTGQVADVHAQGAYVEFVQQVVSFMQQYTTDICPVDRFFTDSAAFPLPAADPTYVVGRLRSYVPKLTDARKRKELAVFIKSVSERAAVDGLQGYLVEQLVTAMEGIVEHGDPKAPSLRYVLLTAVLPVYLEAAVERSCGWMVAGPILEVCGRAIEELFYQTKSEEDKSVEAATDMVLSLLNAMGKAVRRAFMERDLLSHPHVQTTIASIFRTVKQCLTLTRHLLRFRQTNEALGKSITYLSESADWIENHFTSTSDIDIDETPNYANPPGPPCHWQDTLAFSRKQLQGSFNSEWYVQDNHYFIRRGTSSAEVVVPLGDANEERDRLVAALREFSESHHRIFYGSRHGIPLRTRVKDRCGMADMVV